METVTVGMYNQNGNPFGRTVYIFCERQEEANFFDPDYVEEIYGNPSIWNQTHLRVIAKFDGGGNLNRELAIPVDVVQAFLDKNVTFAQLKKILKLLA